MKPSFFFFLFAIFFYSEKNQAQNVTISEGVNVRNDNGYEIVGRHKGNILLFRDKTDEYEINAFDEQMRLIWTRKLVFSEKKVSVLDAIQGKDYFAVIYKTKVKGDAVVKVHRFDGNAKFIDSLTIKNYGNHFMSPNMTSIFSENKKMALIYSFENGDKLECIAFDVENMKVLWEKTTLLPEVKLNDEFLQVILDDTGMAHFIFEKNETAALFESGAHEFVIFTLNEHSNEKNKASLKEYSTYHTRFEYDNINKNLCAVGLYSDLNKSKPTGTFLLKIKGQNPPKFSFEPFTDDIATAITGKKVIASKGIGDLKVQELILRKDGGVIAMIEETREFSRSTIANINSRNISPDVAGRFVIDYYFEDVLAISYNPDASVQWLKVMPKKQFSQDDEAVFSSYGVMKTPNQIRFLFNDDIRTETTTSEYIMKGNGTVDRHSMFNTSNQEILLRFRDGLQLSSDEVVVPSEYRSRLKLVRLKW